ncbi:MAG: YndJ family transporter, partial [Acidimicrobiales bacterium]
FLLPAGWAAVLVLPFVAAVVGTLVAGCVRSGPLLFWRRADAYGALAAVYALVAAGALLVSRAGLTAFGIQEPIVELTGVHYIYAGAAALVLAARTLDGAQATRRRVSRVAVALTAVAPPVVATGFVTRSALTQVGGAVLMTVGVWLTAGLQLGTARRSGSAAATFLLVISGLAVWAPMVLAVAWAAGQHWAIPVLSIPDMARTHGLANALAFVMCGLAGRTVEAAARSTAGRATQVAA